MTSPISQNNQDGESSKEPTVMRIEAFGHQFHLLRGLGENLITLEKEGAIYSHFWDETAQAFRYYRIPFLPKEIFEYVEAQVAKQEFDNARNRGANFQKSLDAIHDPVIRNRVNSYGNFGHSTLTTGDIVDLRGCAASFYSSDMEDLVCGRRRDRYELLPNLDKIDKTSLLVQLIDNFPVVARLLGNRAHNRPALTIENEYDVQDLLYACVRSVFSDARTEEWTQKLGGSAKRIDIVVPSAGVLIETKIARSNNHAKTVADEIKIDIESYHNHPSCRTILVLIYDPYGHITDANAIQTDLSGRRIKGSSTFDVQVMVRR